MAETLLCSEKFVKENSSISDNLAGKFILPSIREAQEIGLRGILGDTLTDKLKALVADGTISQSANAKYKTLADRCQYYLGYTAIIEVMHKVAYKIANMGVIKTSDQNVQNASDAEIARNEYYYQAKADDACYNLQNFLLEHSSDYPELTQNACHKIKSNLYSAASSGIWLGGVRGKITARR